jgi:spore maturation protein CgeB
VRAGAGRDQGELATDAPVKDAYRRRPRLRIAILGLSITSSWGNGHATTYRGLVRELHARGDDVLFLERDAEWYAENRDLPRPPYGRTAIYRSVAQLRDQFGQEVRDADLVIVGSYVPDGIEVGRWVTATARGVTAFYDIDTPVTLARLASDSADYISRALIPRFHLYLSFTGGPTLERLEREYGARMARPLYCAVDADLYRPEPCEPRWDLGYMGTYSADRQPGLDRLLLAPARRMRRGRFAVVGPQYPSAIDWPPNVERMSHLPPSEHRAFYNAQRFTLNLTRAEMVRAGFSPSVRLFEAAACGTAIISDLWPGLETYFRPEREILPSGSADDTLAYLRELPEAERVFVGQRARERVLAEHTSRHRAAELLGYTFELLGSGSSRTDSAP